MSDPEAVLREVLSFFPPAETIDAVDDGTGVRPCPMMTPPNVAHVRRWRAALSAPTTVEPACIGCGQPMSRHTPQCPGSTREEVDAFIRRLRAP